MKRKNINKILVKKVKCVCFFMDDLKTNLNVT